MDRVVARAGTDRDVGYQPQWGLPDPVPGAEDRSVAAREREELRVCRVITFRRGITIFPIMGTEASGQGDGRDRGAMEQRPGSFVIGFAVFSLPHVSGFGGYSPYMGAEASGG